MSKIKISEEFLNNMKELLGDEDYEAYRASFEEERLYGLRVNTQKIAPDVFVKKTNLMLNPIPWIQNGFYYNGEERPAKDPYYYAGLYYLQEPSAMTPANLLPIVPGDKVLDLCAAPGGKSTELGVKLKGEGILVSNDISSSRAKALLKNLELWGIDNICVTSEEPEKLKNTFGSFFDKILVDAPCSGEGMFRKDEDMVKSYEIHGPQYYAPIQKNIMEQAVDMLVPGGLILYSTCTFSVCENEEVIQEILDCHEDMELLKLPLFEGASEGIGLSGCLRLFPHKIKGEGHFMALLQKKQTKNASPVSSSNQKKVVLPPSLSEFLHLVSKPFSESRIRIKNDCVYYLPEGFPDHAGKLRFLRTGLLIGELKKNRMEPSQAFAMSLKFGEFKQTLSWEKEDERVIRYLKGETISLMEEEGEIKGWCLICVDEFPLGFAKGDGTRLKNKYYPGWRWQ